ncbi:MAG: response regulator transcription factor [Kaiparowitsia implicata GSE-PSE-MK54-09C]|jgi:DNA-binding NarL/FixJ family response regulator|nr:response regulator transcription factor [Kaiparowitsia implicata GSE-PSE-MK54-09C]
MPLTVLVVDDDFGTRLAIGDYLELSGYFVLMAENGQRALELVDENKPHLVITDIMMPEMDGFALVQQIRRNPAFRLLPVIFLSARTGTEERIRGYQLGGDVYLPKPFELGELGAVVRNLLERSQLIEAEWRSRDRPAPAPVATAYAADLPDDQVDAKALAVAIALELTNRERGVLSLLSDGLSNVQIGGQLHLSPRTVEKYVSSLLRKTETSNRAELVRFALSHHLVK